MCMKADSAMGIDSLLNECTIMSIYISYMRRNTYIYVSMKNRSKYEEDGLLFLLHAVQGVLPCCCSHREITLCADYYVTMKAYVVSIFVDFFFFFWVSAAIHCEYTVVGYWNKTIDRFDK